MRTWRRRASSSSPLPDDPLSARRAEARRPRGLPRAEFQLIRADATRLDRDGYIADPASVAEYAVEDLVVTGSDDVIVATYLLSATVTIDEVMRTTTASRLSVFSRHGDEWLIAAHATFSPLAEEAEASPAP